MAIKVWLDTDPGSDIDDAVCIGYLLSHPNCDLLGISTVTGESIKRAEIASAVCRSFGRDDLPIYPGTERPLHRPIHQSHAHHAEVLPRWSHRTEFPTEWLPSMRDAIRRHPGEVELLAIGALTNVALLFAIDPELPALLRGLTVMGGRFTEGMPVASPVEHNFVCDPDAAALVFQTEGLRIRTVGLDVTLQVTQTISEVQASFSAQPRFAPILDMAGSWFRYASVLCYHDIVAAATIFSDVCTFNEGRVSIERTGTLMGFSSFLSGDGTHHVAATVDRTGFLAEFCSVTGCGNVP